MTRRQQLGSQRLNRLEERKKEVGSRKNRNLRNYSENFNEMFSFFLKGYRTGILNFSGSIIYVEFELDGDEGKYCFRKIENGEIKRNEVIKTRHPNIVYSVVTGKRSWGLWVDTWSDGIVDWSFTEEEILGEFQKRNIKIPKPLLKDFYNRIDKKKRIRNLEYFDILNKNKLSGN